MPFGAGCTVVAHPPRDFVYLNRVRERHCAEKTLLLNQRVNRLHVFDQFPRMHENRLKRHTSLKSSQHARIYVLTFSTINLPMQDLNAQHVHIYHHGFIEVFELVLIQNRFWCNMGKPSIVNLFNRDPVTWRILQSYARVGMHIREHGGKKHWTWFESMRVTTWMQPFHSHGYGSHAAFCCTQWRV